MQCPHCRVEFHDAPSQRSIGNDADCGWIIAYCTCPKCKRFVMRLLNVEGINEYGQPRGPVTKEIQIYPKGASRHPCPDEVPGNIGEDYAEACLVLADSPKASAALSRRCLQNLLRSAAKVCHGDLSSEIQEVIDSGRLPSHLVENIDAVRNIGNFSAHPMKSESSGEILPVEPGEAEWNPDVLEGLFDFYYVQPRIAAAKRDALNKKLKAAGKPPMKSGKDAPMEA